MSESAQSQTTTTSEPPINLHSPVANVGGEPPKMGEQPETRKAGKSVVQSVQPQVEQTNVEDSQALDPIAELEKMLADEKSSQPKDDLEIEVPEEDKDKPIGRAARTIINLRQRAQAAESKIAEVQQAQQQREQQFQQWAMQQQQRIDEMSGYLRAQQQQQMMSQQRQQNQLDPNDPQYELKKFKMEQQEAWRQDFESRMKDQMSPYEKKIQQLESALKQKEEQERVAKTSAKYNQMCDQASDQLLSGFNPEDADQLRSELGIHLLNQAYFTNSDPVAVSAQFDKFATRYVLGKMKAKASANKTRMTTSQGTPAPIAARTGGSSAKGSIVPTRDQAKAAGYKDELAMMIHQGGLFGKQT